MKLTKTYLRKIIKEEISEISEISGERSLAQDVEAAFNRGYQTSEELPSGLYNEAYDYVDEHIGQAIVRMSPRSHDVTKENPGHFGLDPEAKEIILNVAINLLFGIPFDADIRELNEGDEKFDTGRPKGQRNH